MANEAWATFRLGNTCLKIGSGATPRGGADVYVEIGPYALIRSQNIYNEGFRQLGLAYINQQQADELTNVEVESGDVLLNITGDSVARCCQVPDSVLPARVNQHVAIIRPDQQQLDPQYLRYFLVTPVIQAKMLSWAGSGGTRNALTKGMIESFEVPAPADVRVQKKIGLFLGVLDDKIELNRKVNETLETIARALFKSWFVDFDPVRAKAEGRPTCFSTHLDALFPDSFEDSEIGEIPLGWSTCGLDEIARFLNGLALQKFPPKDGRSLPVIKIAELRTEDTSDSDRASAELPDEYIVENGDVLFSWSGSLACVLWAGGTGALNQHLFKVTSAKYPKWFYWLWTLRHLTGFQAIAADKATTMGHIQRHHLSEARVVVPPEPLLAEMSRHFGCLVDQIILLKMEAKSIAAVRDALVPKLISGEIRLKRKREDQ